MLTKAQFLQALCDTPMDPNADPIATLSVLSEGGSAVDFDVNAQPGGIVVTATVFVELSPDSPKRKKVAGDDDGTATIDSLEQTGFAILSSASMIDVEKAQQNAVRNAINLLGGVAEYIPVSAPINAVVTRPMAQPAASNGNGVVAQAQAVATAAAGGPTCSDCHNPITAVMGKFGEMDPDAYAAWTVKKMGRALCKNCNGRAYAKQQNGG